MQLEKSVDSLRRLGRVLIGLPAGPDADWSSIAEEARRHGVRPLLFWCLAQGAGHSGQEQGVPQEVMDALREDLYAAAAQGIMAERQLARVLGALSKAGVPALVIKGAALGAYYPDPALRTAGDIDIMVPRENLEVAEHALNDLGYQCFASKGWWLDRFHHLPPMVSESGRLLVELHWRLDYDEGKGRLPTEELWARAELWTVRDQAAQRLDAVDAVLYLCRHAVVQHRVHGAIRSLYDLSQVTGRWGEADWETLVGRALSYDLGRPVYLMLALAGELLDLPVPAQALSALMPPSGAPRSEELVRRLLGWRAAQPATVSAGLVQTVIDRSLAGRLKQVVRSLVLPREGMAMVYHIPSDSPRIWLAYLWRPIDLVVRYGPLAWRMLRGEREASVAWERELWLERWLRTDERPERVKGELPDEA